MSHSREAIEGAGEISAIIEDKKSLVDFPIDRDEMFGDITAQAQRRSVPIPEGRRHSMVTYLVALRTRFKEMGVESIVRDIDNILAADCVDKFVGRVTQDAPDVYSSAVELGRRGGLKGGKTRAKNMTPEERSESARKAAKARWGKQAA